MRKTLAGVAIVLALILFYVAWPFASLLAVVRAAHAGDVAAVEQHVDWPAMRRSLAGQMVAAYGRISGSHVARSPLTVGAVTSFMDGFIEKLVLPENVSALMRDGWPKEILSEGPAGIEGLDPATLGNAWQLYLNSDYGIGEVRTTVPFHQPKDKQFRIHLALSSGSWKLSGLDLPVALQDKRARELLRQQRKEG
jgi:hypothetical protein